jgi:hypothetical protein
VCEVGGIKSFIEQDFSSHCALPALIIELENPPVELELFVDALEHPIFLVLIPHIVIG